MKLPIPESLLIKYIPQDINNFLEQAYPHLEYYASINIFKNTEDNVIQILTEFFIYILSNTHKTLKKIQRYKLYNSTRFEHQPFISYLLVTLKYLCWNFNKHQELLLENPSFDSLDISSEHFSSVSTIQITDTSESAQDIYIHEQLNLFIKTYQDHFTKEGIFKCNNYRRNLYDLYLSIDSGVKATLFAKIKNTSPSTIYNWKCKLRHLINLYHREYSLDFIISQNLI